MIEETVTISVSELMNFPPTFGKAYEEAYNFNMRKRSLLDFFKMLNPLKDLLDTPEKALLKRLINSANDPYGPAEVLIFAEEDNPSEEISNLIRHSFLR